ncbi:MAG: hypothetical protein KDK70_38520 [Myxococcales bacterium]|nr:hypothetical protein [Myxococcales bacterium]
MATLVEKITAPDVHPQVIEGCMQLIESEVASKGGLSGAAVKAGYKVVKALKPGMIKSAVTKLLPDFATALQPMYEQSGASQAGADSGKKFSDYLVSNQEQAADALLTVTDAKAANASNKTLKKTYDRLRGGAKNHVTAAIPGLARTLGRFA